MCVHSHNTYVCAFTHLNVCVCVLCRYVKAAGQPPGELVHKSVSKGKKGTGGKKGAAAKSPAATASPVATQTPTVDVEADDIESDGKTALLREKEEEENRMASIF